MTKVGRLFELEKEAALAEKEAALAEKEAAFQQERAERIKAQLEIEILKAKLAVLENRKG